jgi:hypothetical protein
MECELNKKCMLDESSYLCHVEKKDGLTIFFNAIFYQHNFVFVRH